MQALKKRFRLEWTAIRKVMAVETRLKPRQKPAPGGAAGADRRRDATLVTQVLRVLAAALAPARSGGDLAVHLIHLRWMGTRRRTRVVIISGCKGSRVGAF